MDHSKRILPIHIPFSLPMPDGKRLARAVWCYAVMGETTALIDAGVAGAWQAIQDALAESPGAAERIRSLCFTHAHPDHIGAAKSILESTQATSCAHPDAVRWIEQPEAQKKERPVPGFDALVEGAVRIRTPLADGDTITLGGIHLQAICTPGHAAGHMAYYCAELQAVFSGDALPEPHAMPVYTDLGATMTSLRRLQALGPLSTLYSSWEAPIHGQENIDARFAAAFAWLQTVHTTVRQFAGGKTETLMEITTNAMQALGLPAVAANPLTAATVQAHLAYIDEKDISSIGIA